MQLSRFVRCFASLREALSMRRALALITLCAVGIYDAFATLVHPTGLAALRLTGTRARYICLQVAAGPEVRS